MHDQAKRFTEFVRSLFPEQFVNRRVLDVGSGDINGNNRYLFTSCEYHGNDVYSAPNVTIVSKTSALPFESSSFDTICSTECFEHDPEYEHSFKKIVDMLKPGGLFFFTCATTGRPEHGTRRTSPQDSYGTIGGVGGWTDYYKNITYEDLDAAINVSSTFQQYSAYKCPITNDLYFYGVKCGGGAIREVPVYTSDRCIRIA